MSSLCGGPLGHVYYYYLRYRTPVGPEMGTLFYNLQYNNSAQAATTRFKDHFKLTITHQGPPHHTLQGT